MPKCPKCNKEVYFAEKVSSLGKDWHRPCLKCEKCSKTLSAGSHAEHEGKPYCHKPCYSAMFGPGGEYNANRFISKVEQVKHATDCNFKKKLYQQMFSSPSSLT
uniref:LIM zinc-binding domain-containing protein n=1 Tax=Cynoglossus semilaevis TaxID=244447 RepID=A0A3P8V9Y3_CYNSE